jgi:uncharacterized repeat protein (TIGR01451 family)
MIMKKILLFFILFLATMQVIAQGIDLIWARSVGGSGTDIGSSMAMDVSGNIYSCGVFQSTIDFDPGPGTLTGTSNGGDDFFVQKWDPNGNALWVKTFGGLLNEQVKSISVDPGGALLITGSYQGSVDFDPAIAVYSLSSNGEKDVFIMKLTSDGEFIWARSIGGDDSDIGFSITSDNIGNVYVAGHFSDSVDFDPGILDYTLMGNSYRSLFVLKLNEEGDFVWAKSLDIDIVLNCSIALDSSGNVYLSGEFWGGDFDPGPATFLMYSQGNTDAFIMKLNNNGEFLWAKSFGNQVFDMVSSFTLDNTGNIILTGLYGLTVDFDPGPLIFNLSSSVWTSDIFILKLNSDGEFIWAKSIGGDFNYFPSSISCDASGNIYGCGEFDGLTDFDSGPANYYLNATGSNSAFIYKLDVYGNFVWANAFGASGSDKGKAILCNDSNEVFVLGNYQNTVDFDPGIDTEDLTAVSDADIFLLKFSQNSCALISIALDSVANLTCTNVGYAAASIVNGSGNYSFSWNTIPPTQDSLVYFETNGIYTLSVTDSSLCSRTTSLLINGPNTFSGFDLNTGLLSTPFVVSAPVTTLWIDGFNMGCNEVSGQLTLVLDDLVDYSSATILPDFIFGDTLIWNFEDMSYSSGAVQIEVLVMNDPSLQIGDSLCFDVLIDPVIGDEITSNNNKEYCFPVVSSYDPNDKKVYPSGECPENNVLISEVLSYTIRFQNTGNAEALNVYILDSISPFLDITSAKIVSTSHPMYTEVLPGNVMKFVFNDINLPDSTSDENLSHGYVIFEISAFPYIGDGSYIPNECAIYFDTNPPVLTNMVYNTMYSILPLCSETVDVAEIEEKSEIFLYPNPTNGLVTIYLGEKSKVFIRVYDLNGRLIYQADNINQPMFQFNLEANSGMYIVEVNTGTMKQHFKLIKE